MHEHLAKVYNKDIYVSFIEIQPNLQIIVCVHKITRYALSFWFDFCNNCKNIMYNKA